jgi:DNA modification methylase
VRLCEVADDVAHRGQAAHREAQLVSIVLHEGDCRAVLAGLPAESVQCCVTSPPYYGLRDYGCDGQIGLEQSPAEYVAALVEVFREVRRVLHPTGVIFLNLGDGYKNKQLMQMPARVAMALQDDGFYLRSEIIWSKAAPMPESVRDRPTCAHEKVWLLTKASTYFYDADAVREPSAIQADGRVKYTEPKTRKHASERNDAAGLTSIGFGVDEAGRNLRNVWHLNPEPFSGTFETSRQVRVAWDAPCDGKKRKASADCPVHGDRSARRSMVSGGGHAAGSSSRTSGIDSRHAPTLPFDCDPIDQPPAEAIAACNSGSPDHACSPSAIGHSSQTSRTAPGPETTPACKPSAQIGSGTACTLAEPALSEPNGCKPASNTALGEKACSADPQTETGTVGKSTGRAFSATSDPHLCTCEWYVEVTEKSSHFATMPATLAERCIKAGSRPGDTVLDPFAGAGTTLLVADRLQRHAVGIELNHEYAKLARARVAGDAPLFCEVA